MKIKEQPSEEYKKAFKKAMQEAVERKIKGEEEKIENDPIDCKILNESVKKKIEQVENTSFEKIIEKENKIKKVLEGYKKEDEEKSKKGIVIAR